MTKRARVAPTFGIRVENRQTWILTDRATDDEVGRVTYHHDRDGNHYQPWLSRDGTCAKIGAPVSQLGQAAQAIEEALSKASAKRD